MSEIHPVIPIHPVQFFVSIPTPFTPSPQGDSLNCVSESGGRRHGQCMKPVGKAGQVRSIHPKLLLQWSLLRSIPWNQHSLDASEVEFRPHFAYDFTTLPSRVSPRA